MNCWHLAATLLVRAAVACIHPHEQHHNMGEDHQRQAPSWLASIRWDGETRLSTARVHVFPCILLGGRGLFWFFLVHSSSGLDTGLARPANFRLALAPRSTAAWHHDAPPGIGCSNPVGSNLGLLFAHLRPCPFFPD